MKDTRPVTVISGGSKGLGQAIAAACLRQGHAVATFSRTRTPFIDAMLERHPDRFFWASVDITDVEAVKRFSLEVMQVHGRIDALINNAGVGTAGILASARLSDIDDCIDMNLRGPVHLTWACVRFMIQRKGGSIVNVSSVNAVRGHVGVAVYSATKAALDGMTRSLARELGPRGIRVNSVAPGYFESDMVGELGETEKERIIRRTPLGRLGTVDDVAGVVLFLLSESAAFITGQTLVVDGGITC